MRSRSYGAIRSTVPMIITIVAGGYGMLLTEGALSLWIIPIAIGVFSYLFLELLFLSLYFSARYPVNGISHVNLATVPLIFWLVSFTSVGLTVFINGSRLIPIAALGAVSLILFYTISHPEASPADRRRWALLGMWIGIHIGIMGVVLPLTLPVHACLAAICGAFALRVRRYTSLPMIPVKIRVTEMIGFSIFFVAILATASWI